MVKAIMYSELTNEEIYDLLQFDDKDNYKTVITYDTETSTVTKQMNQPLVVKKYFKVGNNDVSVEESFDNYSFICAWTVSITNDGLNYYYILGRSNKEACEFVRRLRKIGKEKLIDLYKETKSKTNDTKIKNKLQDKIRKLERNVNVRAGSIIIGVHNLIYDWLVTKDGLLDGQIKKFGKSTSLYYVKYGYKNGYYIKKSGKNKGKKDKYNGYMNITFKDTVKYFDCKLKDIETEIFNKTDGWDYTKFRTIDTPLSDDEVKYVANDTLKLAEAMYNLSIQYNGLENIPLTKTGIVRQSFKGLCTDVDMDEEWKEAQKMQYADDCAEMEKRMNVNLDYKLNKDGTIKKDKSRKKVTYLKNEEYFWKYDQFLHVLFEGGICQGNINTFRKILVNLHGYDVASMYPFMMSVMNFVRHYDRKIDKIPTNDYTFFDYLNHKVKKGWAGIVYFKELKAKDSKQLYDLSDSTRLKTVDHIKEYFPEFTKNHNTDAYEIKVYNGKVQSGKNIYLSMTDLDMVRMKLGYDFSEPKLIIGWEGNYEPLPKSIEELVDVFCKDKIKYKALAAEAEEKGDMEAKHKYEIKLSFAKKNFNSCYGFLVTNEVKNILETIAEEKMITKKEAKQTEEFKKEYNKYLKKVYGGDGCTPTTYEMGIQTTAYSRLFHSTFGNFIESNNCIDNYGDTDSHKTSIAPDLIDGFNKNIMDIVKIIKPEKLKLWGKKPLGIWEDEGCYPKFIHFNSKRYMHTKYRKNSNEIEKIYVYYKDGKIIQRSSKMFDTMFTYFNEKYECKNIEDINVFNYIDELCKHFGVTYKIVEKLYIKWAGLDGEVLEFQLYDKYSNTNERMNNVFDNNGSIYIPSDETEKLTHVMIDLYKVRYMGNMYAVDKVEFVNNPYDACSCQVLLPQDYCSKIHSTLDQIERILRQSDSLVERI